ncbi:2'-5' RNA ligase family protein [Haladaptatus sp. DJG-WS-42]|uniref:2'-5' RNA ligase family protein n=1 Tax=Haladaptatus sp. DJG-WS-42 TaxID=3120516 RepID=UPI0030D57B1B
MYSLNVPVPGEVSRLAADLFPQLVGFDRIRERHTLLAKRLGDEEFYTLETRLRQALSGAPAFEVQVTGIDQFDQPTRGPGPVVYLAVESPGLMDLHNRLTETFTTIDGLEGNDYTPHITLGRGGTLSATIEPITWTVSQLELFDAKHREVASRIRLPA